jgi:hypothetical protein
MRLDRVANAIRLAAKRSAVKRRNVHFARHKQSFLPPLAASTIAVRPRKPFPAL